MMLKIYDTIKYALSISALFTSISFASLPEKFDSDGCTFRKITTKQLQDQIIKDEKKDCQEEADEYKGHWEIKILNGHKVARLIPADRQKAFEYFWNEKQQELNKMLALQANVYEACKGMKCIAKIGLVPITEMLKLSKWQPCKGSQLPKFQDNDLVVGLVDFETKDTASIICSFAKGYLVGDRTKHRLIIMLDVPQADEEMDEEDALREKTYADVIKTMNAVTIGRVVDPTTFDGAYVSAKGPLGEKISQDQALKDTADLNMKVDDNPDISELFVITKK